MASSEWRKAANSLKPNDEQNGKSYRWISNHAEKI